MLGRSAEVDVTMLVNNRRSRKFTLSTRSDWLIVRGADDEETRLRLYSALSRFQANVVREPVGYFGADVRKWNDSYRTMTRSRCSRSSARPRDLI